MVHCHCCGKQTGVSKAVHCSLCKNISYCSDECAMADWPLHSEECANVVQIASPHDTFFRPYSLEDRVGENVLESFPISHDMFQSFQLSHVDKMNRILTKSIAPLVGSKQQQQEDFGKSLPRDVRGTYTIQLNVNGQALPVVEGKLATDIITKKSNVQGILSRNPTNGLVFWPNPKQVAAQNIQVPLVGNSMQIVVQTNNEQLGTVPVTISGPYRISTETSHRGLTKAYREHFDAMRRPEYGFDTSLRNVRMLHGQDAVGNTIVMTFDVNEQTKSAKLVDIKARVPSTNLQAERDPKFLGNQVYPAVDGKNAQRDDCFLCDASNIDDVTAMCMALEHYMGVQKQMIDEMVQENEDFQNQDILNAKKDLEQLQKHFSVIAAHRIELENTLKQGQSEMDIPTQVNVSINSALEYMSMEPVEAMFRRGRYKKDLRKIVAARRPSAANKYVQKADRLIKDLKDARASKAQLRNEIDDLKNQLGEADPEEKGNKENAKIRLAIAKANTKLVYYRTRTGMLKRHARDLERAIRDSVSENDDLFKDLYEKARELEREARASED